MKTHPRPSPALTSHSRTYSHSHSHSQSSRSSKVTKSTTPAASPRAPYSVGQNHPPKGSPVRAPDARATSPNYFGLVIDSAHDPRDSALARDNWSPASSSIKSFQAALPKHVTLDSNPEFEAFKRQADMNRGKSFALSTSHYVQTTTSPAPVRPRAPRWHTHTSDAGSETPSFPRVMSSAKDRPTSRMGVDQDSLHDSAYISSGSNRNSESSFFPLQLPNVPKFESPRPMDIQSQRTSLTRAEDRDPRLSIMEHRPDPPSPKMGDINRAATFPITLESGQPAMITSPDLKSLMESQSSQLLLLDIRSSQNFAASRISSALNLCIPTTLLKRATFNIEKLKQTFQGGLEGGKFAQWKDMAWIVVYDSHSSTARDAVAAQNMIKKFTNEGYAGKTSILHGGFNSFQSLFPHLIDTTSASESAGTTTSQGGHNLGLAPVIGGVNLPSTANCQNPFFSNIRQNMDLADGVGRLDVSWPAGLEPSNLPQWLQDAASKPDHGKQVSDKFLRIEVEEQARMKNVYAAFSQGSSAMECKVQLCGVEKGGKNRYKDILPFEHARVKLQNKPNGSCDYINASHLASSGSKKRYIASQGPLPATFEDFWSVVWEQDVRVIVMLTAESEGGQLKCHPYWKDQDYGSIKLRLLSEKKASLDIDKYRTDSNATPLADSACDASRKRANTTTAFGTSTPTSQAAKGPVEAAPCVTIRKFALSHSSHPFAPIREITHLYFAAWPDFGTPAQPSHLLALVELANVMQSATHPGETASIMGASKTPANSLPIAWHDEPERDSNCRPMMVHCSAGCGRTGTFCTVDSVIDKLKRQRLAKASLKKSYDVEDVAMFDSDDGVSPMTNKQMYFQRGTHHQTNSAEKKLHHGAERADTLGVQDDSVDLIQKTVEDFREQRLSMVQTLRQYVLCYETVMEWVNRTKDGGPVSLGGRTRSGSLRLTRHDG